MSGMNILAAKEMLLKIFEEVGCSDRVVVTGENADIEIPSEDVLEPYVWLPLFMYKADEICATMTGKRMWDVCYITDGSCSENLLVVDSEDIKQNSDFEDSELYSYPLASSDEITYSLRYLFTKTALLESIDSDKSTIRIKPFVSAFQYPAEHNKPFKLGGENEISIIHLKDFMRDINEAVRNYDHKKNPEIALKN